MRATRPLISLLASALCSAPLTLAQVPDLAVAGTAPIPGAGHHYIGTGVESVSPADAFSLLTSRCRPRLAVSCPSPLDFVTAAPNRSICWSIPQPGSNGLYERTLAWKRGLELRSSHSHLD
jgi:hypothetical protein